MALGIEEATLEVPSNQKGLIDQAGGHYVPDFITESEELLIIEAVDRNDWAADLSRRTQQYGYKYGYAGEQVEETTPIPDWADALIDRLHYKQKPNQLIINEYKVGQGVAAHTDSPIFGPQVFSISLGSDCIMRVGLQGEMEEIVLKRRSLLLLEGFSRKHWLHGIPARKADEQNGQKFPRERRISLTFRTFPA